MDGALVVDKPAGPTSHDVVDRVRRVLGERRVGHTGTLDPFATGVLPLCLGKATRLARFLGGEKAYEATLRFGYATTTDDLTGKPLADPQRVDVGLQALSAAVRTFTGDILQLPPAFSAKRAGGQRHYERARAGKTTERVPCRVRIDSIEIRDVTGECARIAVRCSGGTYIRALARDIGERLGVGAHLVELRRTRSGPFAIEGAVTLEQIGMDGVAQWLVPLGQLLTEIPAVTVGEQGLAAVRHGRDLGREHVASGFPTLPPERVRVLDSAGALVALAVPRGFGPSTPGLPMAPVLHPDLVLLE